MTTNEFNCKYEKYLEQGHYGLDIECESIVEYLDKVFTDLIKIPGFEYQQIKLKFNSARFYSNLSQIIPNFGFMIESKIEEEINRLVSIEDEVLKRLKNQ
jgi:hypothetical protein